jgi:hypothetical protein
LVAHRINELKDAIPHGGPLEAVVRALLYIRRPEGLADERGFNFLRHVREDAGTGLTVAQFKQLVREQFFLLLLDERRAVEAIPDMLASDPDVASSLAGRLRQMIDVVGVRNSVAKARLAEIEQMMKRYSRSEDSGTVDRRKRRRVEKIRPHAIARSKHH